MLTIYQIYCKDPEITDCYIGSTKNYKKRIINHTSRCSNESCRHYNFYVYKFIRENGGFENWDFKILNQIEYYEELRAMQEQAYITLIKPSLNSRASFYDKKEYFENNKDKIAAYRKEQYKQNRAKIIERAKEWVKNNKERAKERAKEWGEKNKERAAERAKEWYKNNKERAAERKKEYREKNKEIISEKAREKYKKAKENQALS